MKSISIVLTFVSIACIITSCFEDTDVVADYVVPTEKGFYPVSGNTFVDLNNGGTITANRSYPQLTAIRFELQYWSDSPVQEINLYQTIGGVKEKVMSQAYQPAFSSLKSCDTLLINYTMPAASGKAVKLDVEILNKNTLSLVRTLTVRTP